MIAVNDIPFSKALLLKANAIHTKNKQIDHPAIFISPAILEITNKTMQRAARL